MFMNHRKIAILISLCTVFASAGSISYTGAFSTDDEVQTFAVNVASAGTVTIQSFSFGGGVNAAGTTILPGGFSPDLWLFDGTGTLLLLDSPESPHHAAPGDCGVRAIDAATAFCWDGYIQAALGAGSYTVALTQDGNNLADGFSLAGGFTEQGVPNYTDFLSLGGMFYLPDGLTQRDGHWAVDITGVAAPVAGVPEPATWVVGLAVLGLAIRKMNYRVHEGD